MLSWRLWRTFLLSLELRPSPGLIAWVSCVEIALNFAVKQFVDYGFLEYYWNLIDEFICPLVVVLDTGLVKRYFSVVVGVISLPLAPFRDITVFLAAMSRSFCSTSD